MTSTATPLLARLVFVQADARHLGLDEGGPRDHAVVGAELLERIEQRVDGRVPGLVRGGVGELVRPGHVAGGVDVREVGLQEAVDLDGAASRRRRAPRARSLQVGRAADGDQQRVEGDAHFAALRARRRACFSPSTISTRTAWWPSEHVDAFGAKALRSTSADTSASSRSRRRGAISTCVTREPRRANACASSQPIGRRRARRSRAAARAGPRRSRRSAPRPARCRESAARTAVRRSRSRCCAWSERRTLPSAAVTSTSHGETMRAVAEDHVDAERGVALDRVVRLDRLR